MLGLAHRGFAMNDYSEHLVQILIEAGYRTYLSGIQHEAEDWRTVGYHECIGDRPDAHTRAAEFLRSAPAVSKMGASHSDAAQPFFLSVGFFETHREFPELDSDDEALYVQPPAVYPNAPETRRDFARFRKSAALLDDKIGTVLDALDESGLRDNTLVLCTTDHGPAFPRMKCNLTDAGIGVMLILRGPDGFDGGRIIDGMVSQIDILPTLCELIDLPVPEHAQGHSLMPLVRDECDEVNDAIFAEVNFHGSYEPVRCVRTHRWKYIRRYYEGYLPSCDVGETRSRWLERGWADRPLPAEELYDLELDPSERTNLAADAHFAPVRDPLAGRLDEWML
jgi:arylsulfatase A-like enzyme